MKTFILITLLSLTAYAQTQTEDKPVDRNARDDKFAGVDRMRGWDDSKKDSFYKDLNSKTPEEVSKKYPDFDKDEVKDLKSR
jgi:hypothetical protein